MKKFLILLLLVGCSPTLDENGTPVGTYNLYFEGKMFEICDNWRIDNNNGTTASFLTVDNRKGRVAGTYLIIKKKGE